MSRRVFISGGTGYFGANYAAKVIADGGHVTLLCRPESNFSTLDLVSQNMDWRSKTRILRLETSSAIVDAICEDDADAFVHFAAKGRYNTSAKEILQVLEANIMLGTLMLEGMRSLTDASGRARPFVFCGSYWQHSEDSAEYSPNSLYAASKSAFEEIARYYKQTLSLPVIGLKFYDIYGPRDTRSRLVDLIIRSIFEKQSLPLSEGRQKIRLLHVEDAISAVDHALNIVTGSSYNLSYGVYGNEAPTIREIAAHLENSSALKAKIEWGARAYRKFEIFDPFLVERLPGWIPKVSFDVGMDNMLNNYHDLMQRNRS